MWLWLVHRAGHARLGLQRRWEPRLLTPPSRVWPQGVSTTACVPAFCPQARVPLAEVRPDALPSHRPPSPELAEVCVAQRAWKSDPGLGEGKCIWSWDAFWGHWTDLRSLPRRKVHKAELSQWANPDSGVQGWSENEGSPPRPHPPTFAQLCGLTGVWPLPPPGTKAACPGRERGRGTAPRPVPIPFPNAPPPAAVAPPRGGGAGQGCGADAD